jgi:hypothetical protein
MKVSLKSDKNNGYLCRPMCIYNISLNSSKSEIFQTKVVEKMKTHFVLGNFLFQNRAIYEIM